MKKSPITKHATTIILIAIIVLNIITYFMPYYKSTYSPTFGDKEVTNMYLYSGYFSVTPFTTMTLIIPILAIVFLLTDFKNGKPLSFALFASQFMSNILLILSTKSYTTNRQSSNYNYSIMYGYYMCIVMTVRIIQLETKDELDKTEAQLIEEYDANVTGYNSTRGNN